MTTPTPPQPTPSPTTKLAVQDPQALLIHAIDRGATVETIERLVALTERTRASQARQAWHAAMVEFQANLPDIKKTLTARIEGRARFSYRYAPLDEMLAVVRPVLTAHGFHIGWRTPDPHPTDRVTVSCYIAHELGHVEESGPVSTLIDNTSSATPPQRVGSAMTYCRRYSMMNILGIAPEDDDDANGATEPKASPRAETKSTAPGSETDTAPLENWIQAMEEAQSATALQALFRTVTAQPLWSQWTPEEQAQLIAAKDNAKRRLGID
jgi:ERF superfamily